MHVCFPCRTLDLYTSAVLEAVLDPPSAPKPEWREMMMQLSRDSCEVRKSVCVCGGVLFFCCRGRSTLGATGGRRGGMSAVVAEVQLVWLVMMQLSRNNCEVRGR